MRTDVPFSRSSPVWHAAQVMPTAGPPNPPSVEESTTNPTGRSEGRRPGRKPSRDMLAGDRNLASPCSTSSARIHEAGSSREPWEMLYQDLRCCEDQP